MIQAAARADPPPLRIWLSFQAERAAACLECFYVN
jgi:hypothetical protein